MMLNSSKKWLYSVLDKRLAFGALAGVSVEATHFLGLIGDSHLGLALAGVGIFYLILPKSLKMPNPDNTRLTEQLDWCYANLQEQKTKNKINEDIVNQFSSLYVKARALTKSCENLKLTNFCYAKAHADVNSLITIYMVPTIYTYLKAKSTTGQKSAELDLELKEQLSLISQLLQKIEESISRESLTVLENKTEQLKQLISMRS